MKKKNINPLYRDEHYNTYNNKKSKVKDEFIIISKNCKKRCE